MKAPVHYHKGIAYFQDVCDAAALVRRLNGDSRVVAYERGYAVQYHKSGAYFPETEAESPSACYERSVALYGLPRFGMVTE